MAWVVDTCLLLDIGLDDPDFGATSEALLEKKSTSGMLVSPSTFVELAPAFGDELGALRQFLSGVGIDFDEPSNATDTEQAARAWARHILDRRVAAPRFPKRPVADALIGAFASRFEGLLTRNTADFRQLYPRLRLISP